MSNDPVRLLIVTTMSDRPEVAICEGLAKMGMEVHVLCPPEAKNMDALEGKGVRVTRLSVKHRLDIPSMRRIRKILHQSPVDVIYAPRNSTISVSLFASLGTSAKNVAYRGTMGHLSWFDPASWLAYLNPRIDRIVCVSEAVRQYLLGMHLPAKRLVTIYKGHDPAWYADVKPANLSEFGIPAGAFVVGFVGNMRPVKGVDYLLQAAALIPESAPVHFLLVGEVRDKRIEKMARADNVRKRVHLAGYRRDAVSLAAACNVSVMPSVEREGLPRSVLESMSRGIPPIVSNVGGMPELVVNGKSGLVVPPRNAAAIADAIRYFFDKPERCRVLGENAMERVRTNFHISQTIKQMGALFTELAAEKAK